jgi:hypothetical protein
MKNSEKENLVKTLKLILALGLAAALFVGCSKSDTNSNSSSNSNSSNTKSSGSSTTTTTTTTTNTPSTTSSTSSTTTSSSNNSSSAGGGETFTHQEGGIQFTAPAGWKAEPNGDRMTLSTSDGSLSVVIFVATEDNLKAATDALDRELGKVVQNVKPNGEAKETNVNGMQAVSQAGTGEVNGQQIQWAVDLLQAKRPVIVLSFADPGVWEKHQGEYQQFAGSIKKVE